MIKKVNRGRVIKGKRRQLWGLSPWGWAFFAFGGPAFLIGLDHTWVDLTQIDLTTEKQPHPRANPGVLYLGGLLRHQLCAVRTSITAVTLMTHYNRSYIDELPDW